MDKKSLIREKFLLKRKKKFFKVDLKYFIPLKKIIKKEFNNKKINISIYYPIFYELDLLCLIDDEYFKKFNFLLPIVGKNNSMNFYQWKNNDILLLNKYGIPEPVKSKKVTPNLILLPLLAFDKNKNRIGYGKGYYDKYLNKYLKLHDKIVTVGVAFSFQKHHNLPVNDKDFKLNYIITEKGIF